MKLVHFKDKHKWDTLALAQWKSIVKGEEHSKLGEPLFVNVPSRPVGDQTKFDFTIKKGSSCIDAGGFLTVAMEDGSGTKIKVKDAGYFYNGFEVTYGDLIQFEGGIERARVVEVDYANNTLTVDKSMSWKTGTGITLAYNGSAPDIGAFESGASVAIFESDYKSKSVNSKLSISSGLLNNSISISYNLTQANLVNVTVYNTNGQIVDQLFSGFQNGGTHKIVWSAENRFANGLYLVRVKNGNRVESCRISLVK